MHSDGPIFFDNRWNGSGGIGRFAVELQQHLVAMYNMPLRDVDCGGRPFESIDPWRLGRYLRRQRAALYISPGYNVPQGQRCQVVTTVHDLIHLETVSSGNFAKRMYYRFLQSPTVRRSPLTMTVSEYSREQIIRCTGVSAERVVNVGNGVSPAFISSTLSLPHEPPTAHRQPYYLYVGNDKPHKNLDTLLAAMQRLVNAGTGPDLVMVTRPSSALVDRIASLGLAPRVQFVAGVIEPGLASLYRGAIAMILPSFIEGFGLPIIEAMACGCPVIGSDRTATAEIIGDSGLQFNPDSVDQLVAAMSRLEGSMPLRQRLITAGQRRAADFRWTEVAARAHAALTKHCGIQSTSPAKAA